MEMVTSLYTVALRDCPDVRPRERIAAETRYAHVLERLCGGPEGVAAALHTIYSLEDSPPFELTSHEQATARLWSNAAMAARQAAYDFLGEPEGAYFDVRLT